MTPDYAKIAAVLRKAAETNEVAELFPREARACADACELFHEAIAALQGCNQWNSDNISSAMGSHRGCPDCFGLYLQKRIDKVLAAALAAGQKEPTT